MVVARKLNMARIISESELCLGYNSLKEKHVETIYIFLKGNDKICDPFPYACVVSGAQD